MPVSVTSQVGSLCEGLPGCVYDPPIEAVVFGWGVAEDGQLGLDTYENVLSPKVVEALLGTRFRGREFGRAPLVAGSRNTLAIDAEGQVLTWGWNGRGTLGHGHRGNEPKPRRVAGLKGVRVVQVAIGGWHALAVDEEGQMWAWGGNEYGQCGVHLDKRDVPVPTRCLPELRVQQVAAGGMHSLALTEGGEIFMWGEPWGDFSVRIDRSPRRIDVTGDFVSISCGAFHNLALNAQGEVFSWGINDFGQLGNGTTQYCTQPERVEGLEGVFVSDIAAGGWHSMALSAEGEVFIWGRGEYGRLGLGDRSGSSKLRPVKLKALEGHRVVQGSCGGTHTMVVTQEGRCFIWGRGAFGRLGGGNEKNLISPAELKLPGGPERWHILSVSAGGRHSLVLALPVNVANEGGAPYRQLSRRSPYASSTQGSLHRERSWLAGEADDEASPESASLYGGGGSHDGISPVTSAVPLYNPALEGEREEGRGVMEGDGEGGPEGERLAYTPSPRQAQRAQHVQPLRAISPRFRTQSSDFSPLGPDLLRPSYPDADIEEEEGGEGEEDDVELSRAAEAATVTLGLRDDRTSTMEFGQA